METSHDVDKINSKFHPNNPPEYSTNEEYIAEQSVILAPISKQHVQELHEEFKLPPLQVSTEVHQNTLNINVQKSNNSSINDSTKNYNLYNKEKGPDVMISFNAKTMTEIAKQLKLLIQKRGFTVFICNDIVIGTEYREDIVDAAKNCRAFLALINEEWASSNECKMEYNIVLNRYLHPEKNKPLIIPVIIGDWDITKYNSLIALQATIQLLFLPKVKNIEDIFNNINDKLTQINQSDKILFVYNVYTADGRMILKRKVTISPKTAPAVTAARKPRNHCGNSPF